MKKTRHEIAFLLYRHPDGLTGQELYEKARRGRPIKPSDPELAGMVADGLIATIGDRYVLTEIGHMAFID